jgi:hypothetical protein
VAQRSTRCDDPPPLRLLPALMALIGLGSSAFHTLAVLWTEFLDVACIGVFIYFFIACFLRYVADLPWSQAWIGMPLFWLLGKALSYLFPPQSFNGSVGYFPAFACLLLMGGYLASRRSPDASYYFAAAVIFAVSLTLRTLDLAWCATFPVGTHWAWHSLNAITLYLASYGLIRGTRRAAPARTGAA